MGRLVVNLEIVDIMISNTLNEYKQLSLADMDDCALKKLNYSDVYKKSGMKLISQQIENFCSQNNLTPLALFIDTSVVAESTRLSKKLNDFIFYKFTGHPLWNKKDFSEEYRKIYTAFDTSKRTIYYHKDFFRKPANMQTIISLFKHSDCEAEIELSVIGDLLSNFDKNPLDIKVNIEDYMIQKINEETYFGIVPLQSPNFDEFHENETKSPYLKINHRCFHQVFHKRFIPDKEKFQSVFISIPIVGTSAEADGRLSGQGAIFLFLVFEENAQVEIEMFKSCIRTISYVCKDIFLTYLYRSATNLVRDTRSHALCAAISAIMSRNFSHNIGSHVLANVTSTINELNVQDNAILFKYIQQRNDFLALVTTEFPCWSYPAWFTKEMMRWFYMQKHLLNYIGRAEGLRAYTFDGEKKEELSFITKFIRKRKNDGLHENIITWCSPENFDCEKCTKDGNVVRCDLSKDIPVAIPGGVLGFHSFYVILENFIRNSAKHSFQGLTKPEKDKGLKITIELVEDDSKPWEITLKIYDNCTDPDKKDDKDEGISDKITKNIQKKFINNDGSLKKENWGIAEMKIAAGFLQKASIERIGAEGKENLNLLKPIKIPGNVKNHMGYEFKMLKPKEVLITGCEVGETDQNIMNKYSIKVDKSYSDAEDVDFEFMVVMDSEEFVKKITGNPDLIEYYPYRIFVVRDTEDGLEAEFLRKRIVVLKSDTLRRDIGLASGDIISSLKNHLLNSSAKSTSDELTNAEKFKHFLYKKWIEQLKGFREISGKINLCLKFTATEGKRGNKALNDVINKVVDSVKGTDQIKGCILEGIKNELTSSLREVTGIGDEDYFPDTLPPILKKEENVSDAFKSIDDSIDIIKDSHNPHDGLSASSSTQTNRDHTNCICYRRHDPVESSIFSEYLSGAADHYPIFVNPPEDTYHRQKLIYQMVENGLLRIAVADERVVEGKYDFNAEGEFNNQKIKLVYGLNNYQANVENGAGYPYVKIDTENSNVPDNIDILIIHQGILDSKITWNKNLNRKMFIKKLKEKIPFIVITSGRGRPDIPSGTKFLSFSIIEECLLSKPISKFILTQTLMSLKEKQEKGGEAS